MKVRIQIITFPGMLIWFEFSVFKKKLLDKTALKRNIVGRLSCAPLLDYLCIGGVTCKEA